MEDQHYTGRNITQYFITPDGRRVGNAPRDYLEEQGVSKAELDSAEEKMDAKQIKANGKEYADSGVLVPFTKEDGDALLQVKAAFELGVTETIIHLSNGQKLPITAEAFPDFALWFATERNQFFVGE